MKLLISTKPTGYKLFLHDVATNQQIAVVCAGVMFVGQPQ